MSLHPKFVKAAITTAKAFSAERMAGPWYSLTYFEIAYVAHYICVEHGFSQALVPPDKLAFAAKMIKGGTIDYRLSFCSDGVDLEWGYCPLILDLLVGGELDG